MREILERIDTLPVTYGLVWQDVRAVPRDTMAPGTALASERGPVLAECTPVEWPYPFAPIEHPQDKTAFEAELRRELKPGHTLFGLPVAAIGRRYDQDDVIFEVLDGSGRVADVHLTWGGEKETPPWPGTALFDGFTEWVDAVRRAYP